MDIVMTTSIQRGKCNVKLTTSSILVQRCEFDVVIRRENIVNLMSRFQRFNNVLNTTFIVHRGLNLLSKLEVTLDQCYSFDVVPSTLIPSCVLVVRHCELTAMLSQRYVFAGRYVQP